MMKILNLGSRILVVSALLVGCGAKPLTKAEQAALDNRQLVFETCEKFMIYSDALVIDLKTPSESLEVLRPIVNDFYSASEAEQMNKEYRKVYSVLSENEEMMSTFLAYSSTINPDYYPDDKEFKKFTENLSEARIFCIDFIKLNKK